MATSTDRSVDLDSSSSNWSSVDIDDKSVEAELTVGASPPMAVIAEEEEDLVDYDDDDDDDSMISGDYTEDEDTPPEPAGRPIYSSVFGGVEDMNKLGLSELSDAGDSDVTEVDEEEEETTKCCGKGALRKIKSALTRFAAAAATIIYRVYAMMTPKQKMVIVGAATAAVMSMVGIEREEAVTEGDVDDEVATDGEGNDELTPSDVMKDVASDFIHVFMDSIDKDKTA